MMCYYIKISIFSNKVLRINFSNRFFNKDKFYQIKFVKRFVFCDGGKCYYDINNDCDVEILIKVLLFFDVENMFFCGNDNKFIFELIESSQRI